MNDFNNLEHFRLVLHGDRREQEWWTLVASGFSNYEIFWQRYIVPLTNRINPKISDGDERWSRLRAGIPQSIEKMAMHHYSAFYYLARATKRLQNTEGDLFPEDIFYLLQACTENVALFRINLCEVIRSLSGQSCFWSKEPKHECAAVGEIEEYRNAFLHNAVLGRVLDGRKEFLPVRSCLKNVEGSWREAEKLGDGDWVEARLLLETLRRDACAYLNLRWEEAIQVLDGLRTTRQFMKLMRLDSFLPICEPQGVPTTNQPYAASGNVFDTLPAREVVTLSSNTQVKKDELPVPPESKRME